MIQVAPVAKKNLCYKIAEYFNRIDKDEEDTDLVESPLANKDINLVIDMEWDLIKPVVRLIQISVIKGFMLCLI